MLAAGALLDGRFRVLLAPGTTCALLVGRFITAIMKNRAMRRAQITIDLNPISEEAKESTESRSSCISNGIPWAAKTF